MSKQQNAILWPEGYTPGFTENFASNEIIAAGLSAADVWPLLVTPSLWPSYYANSANVRFHGGKGPVLADGDRFYFETFGFPVEGQCNEYVAPADGQPGRVARHGWSGEEGTDTRTDVHHAAGRGWTAGACASSRRKRRRASRPRSCTTPNPTR